ncbi:Uncharacterised protein [uncultured archaeon]|nr:Uncharacterised protein [uncultured archaeon]
MKRFMASVLTARAIPAEDKPIASILEYERTLLRRVGNSRMDINPSPFIRRMIPIKPSTSPPTRIGSLNGIGNLDIMAGINLAMTATPPINIIIQLPLAKTACFKSCSTTVFLNPITRPRKIWAMPINNVSRSSSFTDSNLWIGKCNPAITGPAIPRIPCSITPLTSTLKIGKPKNSPYMKPNITESTAERRSINASALSPPVLNLFLITSARAATMMPYPTSPSIMA